MSSSSASGNTAPASSISAASTEAVVDSTEVEAGPGVVAVAWS